MATQLDVSNTTALKVLYPDGWRVLWYSKNKFGAYVQKDFRHGTRHGPFDDEAIAPT